ncbi:hypothetical protein Dimus_009180 [Dionaea muscipula]
MEAFTSSTRTSLSRERDDGSSESCVSEVEESFLEGEGNVSEASAVEICERQVLADVNAVRTFDSVVVVPKFGVSSVCGRRRDMEDAVAVHPLLCRGQSAAELHYFAVYDGHGCSHVATRCRERLHDLVREELTREEDWIEAMKRSFHLMDKEIVAWNEGVCGNCRCELRSPLCDAAGSTAVVAIVTPDKIIVANVGDSRAVLSRSGNPVPLSSDHKVRTLRLLLFKRKSKLSSIYFFKINKKDILIFFLKKKRKKEIKSHAKDAEVAYYFLCIWFLAQTKKNEKKPDRPDELKRIQEAGGRVIYWDGPRVLGVLAMSRAIGDTYLKPYVSCVPEVTVTARTEDDDCLILASDGLWDVVSNDTACGVASICLGGKVLPASMASLLPEAVGGVVEVPADKACSDASTLLTKLALARHSADNVSVLVVDLRNYKCGD